jgi:uncharacterized protein involved in outer membrane biogenesis
LRKRFTWAFVLVTAVVLVVAAVLIYALLATYDLNRLKPRVSRIVGDAIGREVNIRGDIGVDVSLSPTLVLRDVTVDNAPWASRPKLADFRRVEVQFDLFPLLKGRFHPKRAVLNGFDVVVEKDDKGRWNVPLPQWRPQAQGKGETERRAPGGVQELWIEEARLEYRTAEGDIYEISVDRLKINRTPLRNRLRLDGLFHFRERRFHIEGDLGGAETFVDPEAGWPVSLIVKSDSGKVSVEGQVQDPLKERLSELSLSLDVEETREFGELVGIPVLLEKPLHVESRFIHPSPHSYKFLELKVSWGSSEVRGDLTIHTQGEFPQVDAELSSDRLDVRQFVLGNENTSGEPNQVKETEDSSGRYSNGIEGIQNLLESLLGTVKGSVTFRAERVLFPDLTMGNLALHARMHDNVLVFKDVEGNVWGGTFRGNISLEPGGEGIGVDTNLEGKGLRLDKVLGKICGTEGGNGLLDVDLKVEGRGVTRSDLAAHLSGYGSLALGSGSIPWDCLNRVGENLAQSLFKLFKVPDENAIEVNCMVLRLDLEQGIAKTPVLICDTDRVSVVGKGSIDLEENKFDLRFDTVSKEGIGVKGIGSLQVGLQNLKESFSLTGSFSDPSLGLDPTESILTLGKAIGGVLLFGPAGALAALLSVSRDVDNPCVKAMEAAEKGIDPANPAAGKSNSEDSEKPEEIFGDESKRVFGE